MGTAMDLDATNLSQSQLVLALCTELVGQAAPLPGSLLSLSSTPTGWDSDATILNVRVIVVPSQALARF
jgi:hypothetical protein